MPGSRSYAAFFHSLAVICVALLVSSCTMIQHTAVPEDLVDQVEVSGFDGIRTWADDISPEFQQNITVRVDQLRKSGLAYRSAHILALSGGGQNGAFGAGILTGWSASGDRPEFEVVSGVSTGALIAPLAFLGRDYDETLERVYTGITTRDVLIANPIGGLLGGSALASNHPLSKIIDDIVDEEFLAKTAEQHRRGRRLYVVTTNLEAQRPVAWNMSGIAASGRPDAEKLFESLLLASAAIPGAFPPVPVQVEVDGQTFTELHVDGGATANIFIGPINSPLPLPSLELKRRVHLHVVQDGKLSPVYEPVKPRTLKIAGRGIGTHIHFRNVTQIKSAGRFQQTLILIKALNESSIRELLKVGYSAKSFGIIKNLSGRIMMQLKSVTAAMFSVAIGLSVSVQPLPTATNFLGSIPFKLSEAKAQYGQARRVSRRTARRTTRRVAHRTSIAGCSPYRAYYNCGGVYYQPIQESGQTVYIVVNP